MNSILEWNLLPVLSKVNVNRQAKKTDYGQQIESVHQDWQRKQSLSEPVDLIKDLSDW